jgi:hypothetical protein
LIAAISDYAAIAIAAAAITPVSALITDTLRYFDITPITLRRAAYFRRLFSLLADIIYFHYFFFSFMPEIRFQILFRHYFITPITLRHFFSFHFITLSLRHYADYAISISRHYADAAIFRRCHCHFAFAMTAIIAFAISLFS